MQKDELFKRGFSPVIMIDHILVENSTLLQCVMPSFPIEGLKLSYGMDIVINDDCLLFYLKGFLR